METMNHSFLFISTPYNIYCIYRYLSMFLHLLVDIEIVNLELYLMIRSTYIILGISNFIIVHNIFERIC